MQNWILELTKDYARSYLATWSCDSLWHFITLWTEWPLEATFTLLSYLMCPVCLETWNQLNKRWGKIIYAAIHFVVSEKDWSCNQARGICHMCIIWVLAVFPTKKMKGKGCYKSILSCATYRKAKNAGQFVGRCAHYAIQVPCTLCKVDRVKRYQHVKLN